MVTIDWGGVVRQLLFADALGDFLLDFEGLLFGARLRGHIVLTKPTDAIVIDVVDFVVFAARGAHPVLLTFLMRLLAALARLDTLVVTGFAVHAQPAKQVRLLPAAPLAHRRTGIVNLAALCLRAHPRTVSLQGPRLKLGNRMAKVAAAVGSTDGGSGGRVVGSPGSQSSRQPLHAQTLAYRGEKESRVRWRHS